MRLKVPYFDGRKWGYEEIIDEDTGKTVGHIRCNGAGSADGASRFHYSTKSIEPPSIAARSATAL